MEETARPGASPLLRISPLLHTPFITFPFIPILAMILFLLHCFVLFSALPPALFPLFSPKSLEFLSKGHDAQGSGDCKD